MGPLDASDENPENMFASTNIAGADNSQSWNTNEGGLDDLDFEFDSFGSANEGDFGMYEGEGASISFGDAEDISDL